MLWLEILVDVWLFFSGLVVSVIVHELGHAIILVFSKQKVKVHLVRRGRFGVAFRAGDPENYSGLSASRKYWVYLAGVLAGLIPIAVLAGRLPVSYSLLMLVAYAFGSRHDFRLMYVQLEKFKQNKERDANAGQ